MESNVGHDLHRIVEECTPAHANVGYVLITCCSRGGPSELDVRMTYQGEDRVLMSYLLQNAAEKMLQEVQVEEEEGHCS